MLPTMFDSRTNLAKAVLQDVKERYQIPVLDPPIAKSVRFAEAPAAGVLVLATASSTRGADAYRKIAKQLMKDVVE